MIELGIFLLGIVAGCAICVSYKATVIVHLERKLIKAQEDIQELKMSNLHHALWALQQGTEIEAWEAVWGKFPGFPVGEDRPPGEKTEGLEAT